MLFTVIRRAISGASGVGESSAGSFFRAFHRSNSSAERHEMSRGRQKNYSEQFGGLDIDKNRYDGAREGYVDEHGNYHYNTHVTGIDMDAAVPSVIPLHGKNGEDNSEWIKILAAEDHGVNIQKRNDSDYADGRDIYYQTRHTKDDKDPDAGVNPVDQEAYRQWSDAQGREEEDEEEDPVSAFVHDFLCNLNEADQTIMFGIFGSDRKQDDVGNELGRKQQSVSRSVQRIEKHLKKELADKFDYHGEDRTKK